MSISVNVIPFVCALTSIINSMDHLPGWDQPNILVGAYFLSNSFHSTARKYTLTYTCAHKKHTHMCTAHTHAHTCTHTHMYTHIGTHTHTHTHARTCTHAHTHMHTHTHICTRTYVYTRGTTNNIEYLFRVVLFR